MRVICHQMVWDVGIDLGCFYTPSKMFERKPISEVELELLRRKERTPKGVVNIWEICPKNCVKLKNIRSTVPPLICHTPPLWINFFSISCSFSGNYMLAPPAGGLALPPTEILDPPLANGIFCKFPALKIIQSVQEWVLTTNDIGYFLAYTNLWTDCSQLTDW